MKPTHHVKFRTHPLKPHTSLIFYGTKPTTIEINVYELVVGWMWLWNYYIKNWYLVVKSQDFESVANVAMFPDSLNISVAVTSPHFSYIYIYIYLTNQLIRFFAKYLKEKKRKKNHWLLRQVRSRHWSRFGIKSIYAHNIPWYMQLTFLLDL